jgi:hypothetical protein
MSPWRDIQFQVDTTMLVFFRQSAMLVFFRPGVKIIKKKLNVHASGFKSYKSPCRVIVRFGLIFYVHSSPAD